MSAVSPTTKHSVQNHFKESFQRLNLENLITVLEYRQTDTYHKQ